MRIVCLGTNGWMSTQRRQTSCYCFEYGDRIVFFDVGSGLSRLSTPYGRKILRKKKEIYILLSHYHLDHIEGITYLVHFFKDKKVHLAAPGKEIYKKTAKEIIQNILRPPFSAVDLAALPMKINFYDLRVGHNRIGDIEVESILQEHCAPSLGMKIENMVCYLSDTNGSERSIDFVRNARILLHEAWFDEPQSIRGKKREKKKSSIQKLEESSHVDVLRASMIAKKANIDKLLLIHLNPLYDDNRLRKMELTARRCFSNTLLADDGIVINI